MNAQIKKVTTNDVNVSDRKVTYDLYVNGEYVTTFADICDALDAKDSYN